MFCKVTVSLPKALVRRVDEKRKILRLSGSEFFKRALETFLSQDDGIGREFVKKYARICAKGARKDLKISREMMRSASKTVI